MKHDALDDLRPAVKQSRHRFLETIEPLRPELFRLARGLAPTVWEAEDLVQETLMRAFVNLGRFDHVANTKAYLFRIATNAWLDELARRRPLPLPDEHEPVDEVERVPEGEVREALETLVHALPPRERAAVLLRDVFGFTLAECAQALRTTTGAVKAALFRGRRGLDERGGRPVPESHRCAPADVVDAFVAAFNARDVDAVLALVAPEATTEIVGIAADVGSDAARSVLTHTLEEAGLLGADAVAYRGEPIVLLRYRGAEGEVAGDLVRLEHAGGRVTRYRSYYFAPELLEAVGAELGVAVRTQGRSPA